MPSSSIISLEHVKIADQTGEMPGLQIRSDLKIILRLFFFIFFNEIYLVALKGPPR